MTSVPVAPGVSSEKYRGPSPANVQSAGIVYVNGALKCSERPLTGGGVTDCDGTVPGTVGSPSDLKTNSVPISSITGTAMPTANAAIRWFLDFRSRY